MIIKIIDVIRGRESFKYESVLFEVYQGETRDSVISLRNFYTDVELSERFWYELRVSFPETIPNDNGVKIYNCNQFIFPHDAFRQIGAPYFDSPFTPVLTENDLIPEREETADSGYGQNAEDNEEFAAPAEDEIVKGFEGPYQGATILSECEHNLFRVKDDSGKDYIIPIIKAMEDETLEEGSRVLINDKKIINFLPEKLEKKSPKVHFDKVNWEDIGGLKSQIQRIKETIEYPIRYSELYQEYGLAPSRGLLLYGPPGCGKTLVAKAIASQFLSDSEINEDSFIYLKGGEMLSKWVGEAENNIKSVFDRARKNLNDNGQRSVIFIDEAEAILPARGSRKSSDVETTIVPTFLSEMDGFEGNSTFIILATNFPEQLDPAVIRPGRIDMKLEIGRPDKEDMKDIFKIYLSKTKCNEDCEELSAKCAEALDEKKRKNVSGAMIKHIVDEAMLSAIKRAIAGDNTGINYTDFRF